MDASSSSGIRTPDQRLRVFVSSTLEELAEERRAARTAVARLRLTPVLFELGARPHPPRALYRAYLAQSDVFVGIYWQRFGWIAPGETVSGLEDEYRLAGTRPKLIYVKTPAPERDPRLQALLERVRNDDSASYKRFATAAELGELIENDLALLLTERFGRSRRARPRTEQNRLRGDNLPAQRGRLVDRVDESAAGRRLLSQQGVGLVTLTGPGGSGKSRLALHLAASVRPAFPGGVWFVSLEAISDHDEVGGAIARTLGIRARNRQGLKERLIASLRSERTLLVLDSVEHLLGAVPLVDELLARCPRLTILATSRAPLEIREERELPVPPLAVPEPGRLPPANDLVRYPAVALFVERAREGRPDFAVTDETAAAIAEICARLDGLPLAIELAAARTKLLPPAALLARLERRLPVLVGGARDLPARQQTLRDAIGWSYELLDAREKTLFRRLSVFAGGFDLEVAEALCQATNRGNAGQTGGPSGSMDAWDAATVLEVVDALLDQNLLRVQEGTGGEPRFGMLETIREFGLEQLAASTEEDQIRRCHAATMLALAERAEPELIGPDQAAWLERMDAEHPNLRAALEWSLSVEASPEMALRLGAALWRFWWSRGSAREGRGWLERALAKPGEPQIGLRATALLAAAELAETLADYRQAEAWYNEALALHRTRGDEAGIAAGLNGLGLVLRAQGALDRAQALHEEALAILRRLDDVRGIARTLNNLGAVAYIRGDAERAGSLWEETATLIRGLDDRRSLGAILGNLGILAVVRGDPQRAIALHEEALGLARSLGDVDGIGKTLANLGRARRELGDHAGATAALEEALATCRRMGEVDSEATVLHGLGELAQTQGDVRGAARWFGESLRIFWQTGNLPKVAGNLERLGAVVAYRGVPARAVRLFAAAAAIRETTEAARAPDHGEYEHCLAAARAALGAVDFDAAWAAGTAFTPEQAVAEALATASDDTADGDFPSNRPASSRVSPPDGFLHAIGDRRGSVGSVRAGSGGRRDGE